MTTYEKFYSMLDMIPVVKTTAKNGKAAPILTSAELDDLARIYDILLVPEGAQRVDYENAFEEALRIIIKISSRLDKGSGDVSGKKPPITPDTTPEYIRKSIYFVTYMAYVYKFGMDRDSKKISKAGYQAKVLDKIAVLSDKKVTFGHNSWTKWGLCPEYDFMEGTYVPQKTPFRYMGQKNSDLLFMFKFIAESTEYSSFADLFGGSGVCSLARAYSSGIDEYINDLNYENVCFYLAMTEHFSEFRKECKKILYDIENPDKSSDIYREGAGHYWNTFIQNICNKLNKIADEIKEDYANSEVVQVKEFGDCKKEYATCTWNTLITIDNFAQEYPKFREYIIDGIDSQCMPYFYSKYLELTNDKDKTLGGNDKIKGKPEPIEVSLKDKSFYDEKDRDRVIYAMGLYKKYAKLPPKMARGKVGDLKQSIDFDLQYAVAYIYKRLFMREQSGISWLTLEKARKLKDILSELATLKPRFEKINVLWADTILFLDRPNEVAEKLGKLYQLKKELKKIDESDLEEYSGKMSELVRAEEELLCDGIFTDEELKKLTKKTLSGNLEKAEFMVAYYKNMLVYLDSPYIKTTGYKTDPFGFNKYRDAVDGFLGKYIYSCRFSANTKDLKKQLKLVEEIYKYYKKFKSVQFVCMYIDDMLIDKYIKYNTEERLKNYIYDNLFSDKLEVMLTNFDFEVPNSEYQKTFAERSDTEFEFDASVREANETKFYKLDYDTFMGYVKEAIIKQGGKIE